MRNESHYESHALRSFLESGPLTDDQHDLQCRCSDTGLLEHVAGEHIWRIGTVWKFNDSMSTNMELLTVVFAGSQ